MILLGLLSAPRPPYSLLAIPLSPLFPSAFTAVFSATLIFGFIRANPYPYYPSSRPISTIPVPSRQSASLFGVKAARATFIIVAIPTRGLTAALLCDLHYLNVVVPLSSL